MMELTEFARLVDEMRKEQKRFFRTRDSESLRKSKELEAKVDAAIAAVLLPPQKDLFTC